MSVGAERILHTIPPVFDENSRVLILGTMPSPKSREVGFYYGHPQNRFWRVLAEVFGEPIPVSVEERRAFALRNRIALWDVLQSCTIVGASDASIRNAVPNPIGELIRSGGIRAVFTTGKTAGELYRKFCLRETGMEAIVLPSTSPANCRVSLEQLKEEYRKIYEQLQEK